MKIRRLLPLIGLTGILLMVTPSLLPLQTSHANSTSNCSASYCKITRIGFFNSNGAADSYILHGVQVQAFFIVSNSLSSQVVGGGDVVVCSGTSRCAFSCACWGFPIAAKGFELDTGSTSRSFATGTYTLTVYLTPVESDSTILQSVSMTFTVH